MMQVTQRSRNWRASAAVLALAGTLIACPGRAQVADSLGRAGSYQLIRASRLEVKTGKSGLFGFAGHEHLIRANAFHGEVTYSPEDPARTTIHIQVLTDSLEVLTPPDTEEIRKVTASMRGEVLEVERYPEIRFDSKSVARGDDGYRILAEVTMHGATREVPVQVKVEFRGDTLVARSGFSLKQSDFGIKPFRGGPAGTVRVADQVEFRIEARAVRGRS